MIQKILWRKRHSLFQQQNIPERRFVSDKPEENTIERKELNKEKQGEPTKAQRSTKLDK